LVDAKLGLAPSCHPSKEELDWLAEEVPDAPALGLDPTSLPPGWFAALSRCGVPFAQGGALRWGNDLGENTAITTPSMQGARLCLPPCDRLLALSSLPLKPVRVWIAQRLGVRLKIGADVHLRLWPQRAVLISTAAVPLGGFLSGPAQGTRASLYLPVGSAQHVTF